MADPADVWFVRLDDGRVIRAKSTKSLRYHLYSGRIPMDARVRRSPAEEWTALEWTAEFADIVPKGSDAAPPAPASPTPVAAAKPKMPPTSDMKVLGVRGLVDELLNAVDTTLHRVKLMPAAAMGFLVGIGGAIHGGLVTGFEPPWFWIGVLAITVVVLVGFCVVTALITQMTFVELSRLRPARTKEIRVGLTRHGVQLAFAHFLVGGVLVLLVVVLRKLSLALPPLIALSLIGEVVFWPLWGLMLLFGPIVVIEDCSFVRAIMEWWHMLRAHLVRLLLYEALAVLLGLLMAAPFMVPVLLAAPTAWGEPGLAGVVGHATVAMLAGLALTPLLAYLLVANVYIYLNLRYEFSPTAK